METKLVSIMMPAFNAEAYIEQAIESVLAQSYTQWELIIVDDGSTDRTAQIAGNYSDPRIKLIRQDNGGEATARNTALKNMCGDFLAFLDSDDLYLPHHLDTTIDLLSRQEHVDGVYTDGYYIDSHGNHLQPLSSRRRGPYKGNLFEKVVYGSDVFGPPVCVVLRTDLINKYSLKFDENIVIGPDWDFFIKYSELANFECVEQITCLYRLHTNSISITTGLEKRALEISKCRINTIKMDGFQKCSVYIRTEVFYDLLCNLLLGYPERQTEVVQWREFSTLPKPEQSRLFRLMASQTIIFGLDQTYVAYWINNSCQLDLANWRNIFLWVLYSINPKFSKLVLKLKRTRQVDPRNIPLFADMKIDY